MSQPNNPVAPVVTPTPEQVTALRTLVQQRSQKPLQASAAIQQCSKALGVSMRTWLYWESGAHAMRPALWELALLKLHTGIPMPVDTVPLFNQAHAALTAILEAPTQ